MSDINAFYKALHQVGILNSGSMEQTGEKYFLERYLPIRKSPIVFDVGACSGSYSSTVRAISPSARLFAFEPHPASFERLRANLAGTGATLVRTALGDENGTTSFYDYADQDGTSHATLYKDIIDRIHKGTSKAIDVPIRRLDDLLPELGVEHIDFLTSTLKGMSCPSCVEPPKPSQTVASMPSSSSSTKPTSSRELSSRISGTFCPIIASCACFPIM